MLFTALLDSPAHAHGEATAFFYGRPVPVEELRLFDRIVVAPETLSPSERGRLQASGAQVLAYVSIGEINRDSPWHREARREWFLAENRAWKSDVVDSSNPGLQRFLLEQLESLWREGYRGFFFDTLDSPLAAPGTPRQVADRRAGLEELVLELRRRHPEAIVWANRGFELLPRIAPALSGVVAESLFAGYDAGTDSYTEVSADSREWLLSRLNEVRTRYGLPVVVVDYLPPHRRAEARAVAQKIAALGFIPWVSNGHLDALGVGLLESVPRRILALYDGAKFPDPSRSPAHLVLELPLNHLGYAVDYLDVRTALPVIPLSGRYAGVVTWFTEADVPQPDALRSFLLRQLSSGVRVAIFGQLGLSTDTELLGRLGLKPAPKLEPPLSLSAHSPLIGFEAQPRLHSHDLPVFAAASTDVAVHLGVQDAAGHRAAAILTASWGGLATVPYMLDAGFEDRQRWVLDPFAFLQKALALDSFPVPDVTTENGRRLMTVHIDGDGIGLTAQMPGTPFAGAVVLERVLSRFRVPTTVSFIEGELSASGVNAENSDQLERVAQRISALSHVEMASHTYSHPFRWSELIGDGAPEGSHHLPIADYQLDPRREVEGSVHYLNERIAPQGKSVQVFHWSGDSLPSAKVVEMTRALGLRNVNGGYTNASLEFPSLSAVSPFSRPFEGALRGDLPIHVYAPVADDNTYTHYGAGPFYGYQDVIQTLVLTDSPRRLKPLSLYYHFWSGAKVSALRALQKVYRWALKQDTQPIFLSEYARKVEEFERLVVLRTLEGHYRFGGMDRLRTVRLPAGSPPPDLARSQGVATVSRLPQGCYVTFAEVKAPALAMGGETAGRPHLAWANGRVLRWEPGEGGVALRLEGHLPLRFAVAGIHGRCRLKTPAGTRLGVKRGALTEFILAEMDTGDAHLSCP
ncbi:bifunctional glycoside hydrolase 114/ polysaccharide deacetylase family protein [Corallococcus sp. CA054B]|uniref:bifunctional glycoside hydrolase 114/ polysaccharide deacetylase family protein n=1 Tax=Corallococcus sp. CA054B TaxID=2316734 RepID=UPI0013156BA8|nr:endo alpha-1,4 polygalactosaminidase [Corallococcus sp. CA054B]